ncbi:hypothetical protein B0H17DRAFT_438314 [Mycena rosella]|uniref:Uncharacterized protein n=1 Tax=Mycena rosella TaxID=1033263 RepID=A0AAD7CDL7_MYCRO|nr:hypothetical protein B0H17DRAFT_438314 [Mycena rosella]
MRGLSAVRGTKVVSALLALVSPLHAMWFLGCVKGLSGARGRRPFPLPPLLLHPPLPPRPPSRRTAQPRAPLSPRTSTPTHAPSRATPAQPRSPRAALPPRRGGRLPRARGPHCRSGGCGGCARVATLVQNRAHVVRPIRPRAMAQRVSESLIKVVGGVGGAGGVVGYVMGR